MLQGSVAHEPTAVDVYPENWPVFRVFMAMQTQWHIGFNGRTGLIYSALPFVFRQLGISKKQHADVFEGLQVMEIETLLIQSKKRG